MCCAFHFPRVYGVTVVPLLYHILDPPLCSFVSITLPAPSQTRITPSYAQWKAEAVSATAGQTRAVFPSNSDLPRCAKFGDKSAVRRIIRWPDRDMPADSESDLQLEIGHVLLIDIVGYSKLL